MNCEEASLVISARIDGNLAAGPNAALDAHLAGCEACRLTLAETELQDAALMRAFIPHRDAAYALADRVLEGISQDEAAHGPARNERVGFSCLAGPLAGRGPLRPDTRSDPRLASEAAKQEITNSHHAKPLRSRLSLITGWAAAAAVGFLAAMAVMRLANRRPAPQFVVQTFVPLHDMQPPVAKLTLATGDVFMCPSTERTWRPISPSEPIDLLARVRTADAKCELRLPDGSCVRLNSGTEARFTSGRTVLVSAGEVWSAVPRDAAPLCVSAGQTQVTASGTGSDQGTRFDLARSTDAATVTVTCGTADVVGSGPATTVHGGQVLRAPSSPAVYVCSAAPNPNLASRWQDDLLVLKPGDDPELAARVDQLLTTIASDRGANESPSSAEQEVRARGQAWCTPFACYIRNQSNGGENRRTAARLLADLAPPSTIPDLIHLLADDDEQVRYQAAVALQRLTGQTMGYPPQRWAAARDCRAAAAWRQWWEQNRLRY